MTKASIIVNKVTVRQAGKHLLENISMKLPMGSHLLVSGAGGSGKTLFTRCLTGEIYHEGTIALEGSATGDSIKITRVEQHYHFRNRSHVNQFYYQQRFNSMDAGDSATVCEELGVRYQNEALVTELLEIFGMAERIDTPLLHLSSGEHKRFQLIKAFLEHPDFLVLDEPFTGLDLPSRELLKVLLEKTAGEGCTLILICEAAECPGFIDHELLLHEGHLQRFGLRTPARIGQPASTDRLQAESLSFSLVPLQQQLERVIEINNGSIKVGNRELVTDLNWNVTNGERWWLKGANGSGKSTLLSMITGDNPKAYALDIFLFGKKRGSGESIWDIKKQIGFVSPELQWYFDTSMTVYQAVASGLFDTIGLFRRLTEEQHYLVTEWLQYFGLAEVASKLLSHLSTSEQRLALLARAMVKNPPLLILDEPCQGLDDSQRRFFINQVNRLCEDPNRTLIYVTHYEEEIPEVINRKIELKEGRAISSWCAEKQQIA